MCGIALLIGEHPAWTSLELGALARGRDYGSSNVFGDVRLAVGVLALRVEPTPQPLTDDTLAGCYFAWNGEIFERDNELENDLAGRNDGVVIYEHIARAAAAGANIETALISTLARIEGPYAFVLLDDEPIDLITVAFENPRSLAAAKARGEEVDPFNVPDRQSARASYADLVRIAPRPWRLVEVNVPYDEYNAHLDRIKALIHPCDSVMDLSIGAALYFAGRAHSTDNGAPYVSPARVFLSGLGADELLGGYSRHRQAFKRGLDALANELQLDLDRLPARNLGRDDRIISAHAREMRYPYLARSVIEMLVSLPIAAKMDLGAEGGDKRLLRNIAELLELSHASSLPKRAIQFGARSAKMDSDAARRKGGEKIVE
ncbi:hypothetical protein MCUN1_001696 [Malassezia cuniculi]|uniref:Asparagine synthetase domain-containing protein n=1 Tax=Malassezia cuniculi TaxID=948313 RepID=A0AAF0EY64_9BASI|nr:hypothetical protein MCUN1_001696 [Malassezia cuniculi]